MATKTSKPQKVDSNLAKKPNLDNFDLLRDIAVSVGGKNAGQSVDLLMGQKHVNEFLVAKKLDLTINQTRNILYKLADEGLVSSVRKKDKKKGWYTYFWTFNTDKAFLLLQKNLMREIENLENQLKSRVQKRFYICKSCHAEVTEETALLHDFTCPECGEVYDLNDNSQAINEIKLAIGRFNKKLESVNSELEVIDGKKAKKFASDVRKEEKEKIARRKVSAALRKKTVKKNAAIKNKTAVKDKKKAPAKKVKTSKKSTKKKR